MAQTSRQSVQQQGIPQGMPLQNLNNPFAAPVTGSVSSIDAAMAACFASVMQVHNFAQGLQTQAMQLLADINLLVRCYGVMYGQPNAGQPGTGTQAAGGGASAVATPAPSNDNIILEAINSFPDGSTTPQIRNWAAQHYPDHKITSGLVSLALNRHYRGQRIRAVGEVGKGKTPEKWYPLNAPNLPTNALTLSETEAQEGTTQAPPRRTRAVNA